MESKCILVEGITDMNLEIKQTIDDKPIEISGDGKYDKNKSIINLSKINSRLNQLIVTLNRFSNS